MVVVKTNSGKLEGCEGFSTSGQPYLAFKGIPYAKPPIGSLRFANPVLVDAWDGVRSAKTYGPCSLQLDSKTGEIKGDEDCLYLNVFTRAKCMNEKLPVLVYIHGGGFTYGAGDDAVCGPQNAMDEQWVVVTINYRLGAFGFMAPLGGAIPVNLGLKDQRLALRWIKENVSAFGGNPENITLMGESAGSVSVWFQYLHPSTENGPLFHKLIMQSGSPTCPWACYSPRRANEKAEEFLRKVFQCGTLPKGEALRQKMVNMDLESAKKIMKTMSVAGDEGLHPFFTVVIDTFGNEDDFVTDFPMTQLEKSSRWIKNFPSIIQLNKNEGAFLTAFDLYNRQCGYQSKGYSTYQYMIKDVADINQVLEQYFGPNDDSKDGGNGLTFHQKLAKLYGDIWFDVPICMAIDNHLKNNDVYLIRYAYQSSNTIYDIISHGELKDLGVSHFDEILLLFKGKKFGIKPSNDDKNIAKSMWQMFYNFSITGKAVYTTVDGTTIEVPKASTDQDPYLEIKSNPEMKLGFKPEMFGFWKDKISEMNN